MIGQTISHYKITAKLGEGGMGVVYKAEDTRLKRMVALKFLSANALGDEDQKARFLREAQSAALLDHPNIAAVYDIGETDGSTFMAMALVDGPSLAERIKERPLKLDEALDIAIQMCEGLQEAHEHGVTHRDIKPANIMLTRKGRVKITDFGLAHLAGRSKLTKSGTTLGTPAYMSPEQALGEATDRRSDIWGVGVVLYELIAGKAPFESEHEQATIYSIINEPPEPLTALRTGLPTELDRTVGKALAKEPAERYQHVADMQVDLRALRKKLSSGKSAAQPRKALSETRTVEEPLARYHVVEKLQESDEEQRYLAEDTKLHRSVEVRVVSPSSVERIERIEKRRRLVPWLIAAVAAVCALAVAVVWMAAPTEELPLRRFTLSTESVPNLPSISPDGRQVAYLTGATGNFVLWVQDLAQNAPRAIAGPDNILRVMPAWSPDSQFIVYRLGNDLKKISVDGGPAVTVCRVTSYLNLVVAWTPDGESIVFSMGGRLYRVSSQGGEPEPWLEALREEQHTMIQPAFFRLEDGIEKLLYSEGGDPGGNRIVALNRANGDREILTTGLRPSYSASGHVIYFNRDPLGVWAIPFSIETMKATGEPFPVSANANLPSVALDGTLVYLEAASSSQQLVWRDRQGNGLGTIGQPQDRMGYPALSPDGKRVAVSGVEGNLRDIWIHEVDRPIKTRLTTASEGDLWPTWSASGDLVGFASGRSGGRDLYVKRTDGSATATPLLMTPDAAEYITDWSRDESTLLFFRRPQNLTGGGAGDLYYLRKTRDGDYEEVPFVTSEFEESTPLFSPDERFVAYVSTESGRHEIYIRSFPEGGGKRQVSVEGGTQPRWRADGKELFYVEGESLMAVPITTSPSLAVGAPVALFSAPSLRWSVSSYLGYDVTPDGERFVLREVVGPNASGGSVSIRVVQNWFAEFKDRQHD